MPEVLVIGSVNRDSRMVIDHIPGPGETVLASDVQFGTGGKGANQAVAAARLGRKVEFVACFGADGAQLRDDLVASRIALTYARQVGEPNGSALLFVTSEGENAIVVSPGANSSLVPVDVDAALAQIREGQVILLQNEIPAATVEHAIEVGFARGARVIWNAAPFRSAPKAMLERVDVLIVNECEFGDLLELRHSPTLAECASLLAARPIATDIIVTLGNQGALVGTQTGVWRVLPASVEVCDSVGAGDTFCAAVADALFRGLDLVEAARWGGAAAACSLQGAGAQAGMPTAAETAAMLTQIAEPAPVLGAAPSKTTGHEAWPKPRIHAVTGPADTGRPTPTMPPGAE